VPGQTLTRVTLPAASLQKYPAATLIDVPPVLLEAGKRYALMLITQGDHRVAVVSGNNYTQGTLFYGTDGDYMQGDLTRDLMFGLYGASFSRARTEVALQSVSLAGGITDVEISAQHTVPDGCSLSYEVQVAGRWYPLDSTELHLLAAPPIVPLRAVLLGTSDLAPALVTGIDAVRVSRPDEALVHYSSLRSLAAAASALQVHLVVSAYDSEHHSLNCQLVSGGTTYNPTGVEWRAEPDDADAQRAVFTFAPSPAISSYQVKISASRQAGSAPFTLTERLDVAL